MAEDSRKKKQTPRMKRGKSNKSNVSKKQMFSEDGSYQMGHSSKSSVSSKGLRHRDQLEQSFSPPNGRKHKEMGTKFISKLQMAGLIPLDLDRMESAIARGIVGKGRSISKNANTFESERKKLSKSDKKKLKMMNAYFDKTVAEYNDLVEQYDGKAAAKRKQDSIKGKS